MFSKNKTEFLGNDLIYIYCVVERFFLRFSSFILFFSPIDIIFKDFVWFLPCMRVDVAMCVCVCMCDPLTQRNGKQTAKRFWQLEEKKKGWKAKAI